MHDKKFLYGIKILNNSFSEQSTLNWLKLSLTQSKKLIFFNTIQETFLRTETGVPVNRETEKKTKRN